VRKLIISATLGLSVVAGLSLTGCGKQGELDAAPPIYGHDAQSSWSVSRATERALPDANGKSRIPNPYGRAVPISAAPLEGVGNAQRR
jgi:hypothetical protein